MSLPLAISAGSSCDGCVFPPPDDPVIALQWATLARKLDSVAPKSPAHYTPPLPAQSGPAIMVLGTNPKPSPETRYVLLVSDSAIGTRWQSFASADEVRSLLTALEGAARDSWAGARAVWNTPADREPDTPVTEQNSFVPVLSDDSLFTEAAMEAILRARYQPAALNGEPVPLRVFQVILFRTR